MPAVQYGQGCYSDAAGAANAMAAAHVGAVYTAGSRVWTVTGASADAAGAVTLQLTDAVSADPPYSSTVQPAFQPCSILDWDDGLTIAWGIGAVWLVVAALLSLKRGTKAS